MNGQTCASHHFGPWMIEPHWLKEMLASIQAGVIQPRGDSVEVTDPEDKSDQPQTMYTIVDGIAVIQIAGAMMKIRSKFGGCCTVDARRALRMAAADDRAIAIMLYIDSPGGTCAGTDQLAADVATINQTTNERVSGIATKPVYAHIEDMCASAAYYVASRCRSITASNTSLIGCLGTRMTIIDSSANYAKDGFKVYSIDTGWMKGAGTEGTEITAEQLAYFQGIIDKFGEHFKTAVQSGRGFTDAQTASLFDGKVHDAKDAKQLGLIDGVSTLDAAMAAIRTEVHSMDRTKFDAFAAANPEAVQPFIEQGYNKAKSELTPKAATIQELEAAFPSEDAFIVGQLKANATLDGAKIAHAGKLAEEVKALRAENQKLTAGAGHTRNPVPADMQAGGDAGAVSPLVADMERRAREARKQ